MSQRDLPEGDLDRLDLDEIKRFLQRRWKLIVGTMFGALVLAVVVCLLLTPIYTATSQILLDPRKQHVFGQEAVQSDSALDSSIVDSQIPIILSTKLLAKVVARENLADDPEFKAPARPGLLDRIFGLLRPARIAKVGPPTLDGIDPRLAPVILHLFDRVDVTRVAKSYVLSIAVSSRDPGKATRLANALAEIYVEDQVDVRAKTVQQAATFFEDRLKNLREQVRQSERAVADFRKTHDLTTTTFDGKVTVGEQQLQHLNEQLATISADTAEKYAKYQQGLHFDARGASLDSLPEIIRSPVITQLRTQQADLARRSADLSAMYGPAYPAMAEIRAQRTGLDHAIAVEMKRLVATLKNDYEVAKAREDSLRKTIANLSSTSGGDNEEGVKLRELERTNLANKALFENFLNRAKLAQEQSTFEEPDARLISPALEPSSPSSPKIKLIVPVAGVAGLLLGLGLAALLDMLRRKSIGTPKARANAFVLARIPEVWSPRGQRVDCLAQMESRPTSGFAQAIDALAAKLAAGAVDGSAHIAVLAPLSAGEGATSLALCLATAAGRVGKRVLLVDLDHASRGLSAFVGAAANPGLAEVMAGKVSANKAIVAEPHVSVLPAGQGPADPKASGKRLRAFLNEARGRYDLILLDAPPLDASSDALALADIADGLALVASWAQLARETFVAAIDAVGDKPNFLGIVLNKTALDVEELALAS